jgi:hypothetical protein
MEKMAAHPPRLAPKEFAAKAYGRGNCDAQCNFEADLSKPGLGRSILFVNTLLPKPAGFNEGLLNE